MEKSKGTVRGRAAVTVSGLGELDLTDTLECGQAFRYECTVREEGYVEYLTVVGEELIAVGQRERGELIVFTEDEATVDGVVLPYFAADEDYEGIRRDLLSRCDSEWLARAADAARGIVILRQDPWETLFSFIISQNNNIPRIRKIIRAISAEYGRNLAEGRLDACPCGRISGTPCHESCKDCGICYTFPRAEEVFTRPEGLLPSKPGFRYKYLLDAAERVCDGRISLEAIAEARSYETTLEQLKTVLGVGDKVASCVALFGFGNLEAFPIDVWMKRAIDEYFDGRLDPRELGPYAGVAQQYIFHYIRNLEGEGK